jgi:hypothetical protein
MKRVNIHKTVNQLHLKDWKMKNEILRKAQIYENTIMSPMSDCKSNMIEARCNKQQRNNNENIKLFIPTPLHDSENVNALLKPHCNRSGVYISTKGTNFCDIVIPNNQPTAAASAAANHDVVTSTSEDALISLKMKQQKVRRNKKILKLRKYKEILNDRLQSMISIDKL